jgi:hypothetical protein
LNAQQPDSDSASQQSSDSQQNAAPSEDQPRQE